MRKIPSVLVRFQSDRLYIRRVGSLIDLVNKVSSERNKENSEEDWTYPFSVLQSSQNAKKKKDFTDPLNWSSIGSFPSWSKRKSEISDSLNYKIRRNAKNTPKRKVFIDVRGSLRRSQSADQSIDQSTRSEGRWKNREGNLETIEIR